MRLDWEIARRGYRRYAAYPGATVAGLFTNTIFGFLQAYILLAVYEQRDDVGGYDVADAITYVWLTQGMLSIVASFGPSWMELALRVRSGDVAVDLARPLDLQRTLLAGDLGRAGYQLVYRAVPPFLLGALLFELTAPREPLVWLAFSASVALAVVVSFSIRFVVNLLSFWLTDYRGAMLLAMAVTSLMSGLIMPLAFFPEPWDTVARALPFASMLQLPVDVFVGAAGGTEILAVLAVQALWAVVLLALGRAVLAAGTRRLVIQGG
jgi:ABC-2 type transport system permease protein